MNLPPSVGIVVINWNGLADTRECLHSLQAIDYANARVFVVDNGSDNDEGGVLSKEFAGFAEVLRLPENRGFTGGANAGIERALAEGLDYILLLNNDTIVDPAFLTSLVGSCTRNPGPRGSLSEELLLRAPPHDLLHRRLRQPLARRRPADWSRRGRPRTVRRDRPAGLRRRRLHADSRCCTRARSGSWTSSTLRTGKRPTGASRAREKGLRCYYVPTARIWHKAATVAGARRPLTTTFIRRNALLFVRKRGSPLQRGTALAMHLFVYGPRVLPHGTRRESPARQPN